MSLQIHRSTDSYSLPSIRSGRAIIVLRGVRNARRYLIRGRGNLFVRELVREGWRAGCWDTEDMAVVGYNALLVPILEIQFEGRC